MKRLSLVLAMIMASALSIWAQRTVTGKVVDDSNSPLIGATVLAKGTSSGTVTDIDGNYSLNVPENANVLVFSYTGFETQEITIGASNVVDVTLKLDVAQLSEVVVTGYGSQSRARVTSSIASVDSKAFENVSVQSFEGALQGRLPGVTITGNSGTLGAQQAIRVRGVGSINASNQPLFVVDGLILNDAVDSQFNLGGPGTNPLLNINPNDIESVDVLKDAAAAAIYGSRGANGVILITTKSGKYNQKPSVNIGYYAGWSEATEQYDLLTGQEYAELWNRTRTYRNSPAREFYDVASQPNTDWIDLVSQQGNVQETNAGVSGGTQTTKFFFGGTYRDENGWIKSTNLKRYSFRANIEQQLGDKWLAGIQLNPTRTVNTRQNEDNNVASPQTYAVLFFPNVAAYDDNGEVVGNIAPTSIGRTQFAGTPLGNIVGQDITATTTQILTNTYLEYRPITKLKLRTEFGAQFQQVEDLLKQASYTTDGFGADGSADAANAQVINYSWNNLATYTDFIGRSEFDFTLGFTVNREQTSTQFVTGNTFADDRLKTLASAAEITGGTGTKNDVTFVGFLGRLNYAFDGKYLLSASARVDGSSRFGADSRYGFFPAVSAGWILSEEPFLQNNSAINFLKIRGSYGLAGNAGIGNFDARGLIGFGNDYNAIPGFMFDRLENPNLEWEKSETIDFGAEFGLFNNRFRGSLLYYIRNTRDLLLDVPIPWTTGIVNATLTQNAGEVRNQGLEFLADVDILTGPFQWTLGVNGATVANEVLKLVDNNADGEDDDITGTTTLIRTGEPIGSWYLVEYAGVDPNNGDALFRDLEGGVSSAYSTANRKVSGNAIPDFSGGFTNTFRYKGFDLSVFFQFAMGHQLYLSEGRFYATNMASVYNQRKDQLNAWTPENPNTNIPQARGTTNGSQHSTRYLSDADYLRLKNAQLGYTFNNIGKNNARIRIFAAGQNLLTFTDFEGLDPEASGQADGGAIQGSLFFSRPQSRTVTFGVNFGF